MVALATPSKPTLSPGYTSRHPIQLMTATVRATLTPGELAWVARQWAEFTGGAEDEDGNIIAEWTTPATGTRVWVVDRTGPTEPPMLMLPSDY